jgi:hypothetical protein
MATVQQLESQYQQLLQESQSLKSQAAEKSRQRDSARMLSNQLTQSVNLADPDDPSYTNLVRQADQARLSYQTLNKEVRDLQSQEGRKLAEAGKISSEISAIQSKQSTIKTPTATNESQGDKDTDEKYADSTRVPQPASTGGTASGSSSPNPGIDSAYETGTEGVSSLSGSASGGSGYSSSSGSTTDSETGRITTQGEKDSLGGDSSDSRISPSIKSQVNGTGATAKSAQWAAAKDLRAILRVPASYLKGPAAGPASILKDLGGILFPYTPEINYDTQASYASISPLHSNYTQYYYKSSSVGPITVSGKFTVQNEKEGMILLAIQHLLRSLTKMRFGSDKNAGSPPPVCRFDAYGDYMINNVPVVVASFKLELGPSVDYISVKSEPYKTSLVPTLSTISLTLNPMYSRSEIGNFSVDSWLSGNLKNRGYL